LTALPGAVPALTSQGLMQRWSGMKASATTSVFDPVPRSPTVFQSSSIS